MKERLPLKPVHPFPARMATSIALRQLRRRRRPLRVLDPMAGSGTTIVAAKSQGHIATGFDRDPLAVLLGQAWSLDINEDAVRKAASKALSRARQSVRRMKLRNAYPCPESDPETRKFVRYWFDNTNRRELTALARAVAHEPSYKIRTMLWCAFSRMIITKEAGVSLAMDLAHSRPHKVRRRSSIRPLDKFLSAVDVVLAAAPFKKKNGQGKAVVKLADARRLPLPASSIDLVITSPPYLNAIDYVRCHKFTLVWMGYPVSTLRTLRASNVGSEVGLHNNEENDLVNIVKQMTANKCLPARHQGMLKRYVADMRAVIREIARVLVPGGRATFVIGNSTIRGVFIRNSRAVSLLAKENGLKLVSTKARILPNDRRYLPPPSSGAGAIHNRMRKEVVLTFRKAM